MIEAAFAALFFIVLSGCASTPSRDIGPYPSGLVIERRSQRELNEACGTGPRDGDTVGYHGDVEACYQGSSEVIVKPDGREVFNDKIYVLDNCIGAKALTHELAHREGVKEPSKEGFDW